MKVGAGPKASSPRRLGAVPRRDSIPLRLRCLTGRFARQSSGECVTFPIEVPQLRASVCPFLVVGCLVLSGCKNTGRKDNAPVPPLNVGGSSGTSAPRTADVARGDNAPPGADGLLAGQVLDSFNRHPDNVSIQIVDLQDTRQTPARIEVEPPEKGYFTIQGLQVGRHYQLIARMKDGNKLLSGTTLATPPNPRVTIYLSEDNTTDTTPPLPGPPTLPSKPKPPPSGTATIEAPQRMEPASPNDGESPAHRGPTAPVGAGPVIPQPPGDTKAPNLFLPVPNRGNPANIASDKLPSVPPLISVPNQVGPKPDDKDTQGEKLPPPPGAVDPLRPRVIQPPSNPAKTEKPPSTDGANAPTPPGPTPANSCVLVGKKLEDFSLTDLQGDAWQFKRDHKGQVVLLDFWSTGTNLGHVRQLTALQKSYGSYGLQIVGIAYEPGTPEQQASNVRSIRGRYTVNYTTILGGPAESCQVKKQFDVTQLPTLILLDDHGQILLRADGTEMTQVQEVETEIRKRLGITDNLPRADE
jgi:AhpC/TSA family protein